MSIPHTPLNSPMRKSKSMNDMTTSRMLWPSADESFFTRCLPSLPMIRTPATYTPTHNTDPPPQQVITSEPLHSLLRLFYRTADAKLKRDLTDQVPVDRPNKVPRTA
ncbi:hypothetical protein H257_01532 [Aphanomyces astaci]|uniref:DET1- and DDB1-associated protein 1 domain-containing protein n=1 Tax=Aphanomyces astaci TaxID=112090 RepID=W4H9I5_APHAT|nr:hypothetical protein H257_01532 [Aphanomyces astaci]ETV88226.1 hypothetical protein H257_01532 [Aphanomyces astaci]|eukprot:XP_009823089.1 hypothetical protein H257_01532 [Aphanomyces astaci]